MAQIQKNFPLVIFLVFYFLTTVLGNIIYTTYWGQAWPSYGISGFSWDNFKVEFGMEFWALILLPFFILPPVSISVARAFRPIVARLEWLGSEFSPRVFLGLCFILFAYVGYEVWQADAYYLLLYAADATGAVKARFEVLNRLGNWPRYVIQSTLVFFSVYATIKSIKTKYKFWILMALIMFFAMTLLLILLNQKWPVVLYIFTIGFAIFLSVDRWGVLKSGSVIAFGVIVYFLVSTLVLRLAVYVPSDLVLDEYVISGESGGDSDGLEVAREVDAPKVGAGAERKGAGGEAAAVAVGSERAVDSAANEGNREGIRDEGSSPLTTDVDVAAGAKSAGEEAGDNRNVDDASSVTSEHQPNLLSERLGPGGSVKQDANTTRVEGGVEEGGDTVAIVSGTEPGKVMTPPAIEVNTDYLSSIFKKAVDFAPRLLINSLNRMAMSVPFYYDVFRNEGWVCGTFFDRVMRRATPCHPSNMIYVRMFGEDGFEGVGTAPAAVQISGYAMGGWKVAVIQLALAGVIIGLFMALWPSLKKNAVLSAAFIMGCYTAYILTQLPIEYGIISFTGPIWWIIPVVVHSLLVRIGSGVSLTA